MAEINEVPVEITMCPEKSAIHYGMPFSNEAVIVPTIGGDVSCEPECPGPIVVEHRLWRFNWISTHCSRPNAD